MERSPEGLWKLHSREPPEASTTGNPRSSWTGDPQDDSGQEDSPIRHGKIQVSVGLVGQDRGPIHPRATWWPSDLQEHVLKVQYCKAGYDKYNKTTLDNSLTTAWPGTAGEKGRERNPD